MNTIDHLWKEYHSALLGFIRSRVNDADMAEDILQEVFLKIHSKLDSLKNSSKLKSWIYQITRNAIIDYYRTQRPYVELPETLPSPEKDDTEEVRQRLESCILPLIENLPDDYREAVKLSEIEGMTQKDVAERTGLSLSGAKSRVQRGRAMVKGMLEDCCRFEIDHRGTVVDYQTKASTDKGCCK
jgi:RNA polymerase sigma-70 factor, ECF subfamily